MKKTSNSSSRQDFFSSGTLRKKFKVSSNTELSSKEENINSSSESLEHPKFGDSGELISVNTKKDSFKNMSQNLEKLIRSEKNANNASLNTRCNRKKVFSKDDGHTKRKIKRENSSGGDLEIPTTQLPPSVSNTRRGSVAKTGNLQFNKLSSMIKMIAPALMQKYVKGSHVLIYSKNGKTEEATLILSQDYYSLSCSKFTGHLIRHSNPFFCFPSHLFCLQ